MRTARAQPAREIGQRFLVAAGRVNKPPPFQCDGDGRTAKASVAPLTSTVSPACIAREAAMGHQAACPSRTTALASASAMLPIRIAFSVAAAFARPHAPS